MESVLGGKKVHNSLTLGSSSIPEENSMEIIAETSISIDYSPQPENVTETLLGEPELTVVIILQMTLLILLCLLGICINSLVFWIFNRRPALRSLSNRFVLSLVTANLCISLIVSPLIFLGTVLNNLPFTCIPEALTTIANSVIFSAIFSTLLIATDRYYAVTSPLHYSMTITRSRSQVMIVLAWISGIFLSLPHLLLCIFLDESPLQQNLQIISAALQFSFGFSLPFLGLCWLYWRMYTAAHRNSERTRKHSISGELLTVLDGSTSVIPQGIDFLTHYMNPFSKTPMAGSVLPTGPPTTTGVIVAVKKNRRRSSNGSSSSLLFREEGRAVKTAFFVLASFLLCWSPHFGVQLVTELSLTYTNFRRNADVKLRNWDQFFSVSGMLLSSLLHPFIYVFRNKMACKELTKLLCGFLLEQKRKQDLIKYSHNNNHYQATNRVPHCQRYESSEETSFPLHSPPSVLPKSPRRSSMKSLTPQSSLNSNSTHVNLTTHGSNDSSSSTDSPIMLIGPEVHIKPPFLRSLTLPEQQRVKFPPNLVRQKSSVQRTLSGPPGELVLPCQRSISKYSDSGICHSSTQSRRSTLVRQDSICSILSSDSVLMICADDGMSDVRFCSNSHKIRYSGGNRRKIKMTMDDFPCLTDSMEEIRVPVETRASPNGKIYDPMTSDTNTWNPLSQIPLLSPSCLKDTNFSSTDATVIGSDFGRQGCLEKKEQVVVQAHPESSSLRLKTLSPKSPASSHQNLENQERLCPCSYSTNSYYQEFPILLQTSI